MRKNNSYFPSSTHVNGIAEDFNYLAHNNHQTLKNALHKYGFERFLIGCNIEYTHATPDCGIDGSSGIHGDHK